MANMMSLENAMNLARAAKRINAQNRDVPANAALVTLLAEIDRLRKLVDAFADNIDDYVDFSAYHRGCVLFTGGFSQSDWKLVREEVEKRFEEALKPEGDDAE